MRIVDDVNVVYSILQGRIGEAWMGQKGRIRRVDRWVGG